MPTTIDRVFCDAIFNSEVGASVVKAVANKLARTYGDILDTAECVGWAELGVVQALSMLKPERFVGASISVPKRVCCFLITKGHYLAVDEMRSAGMVGRTRKGKIVEAPIHTESINLRDSNGQQRSDSIVDPNSRNPAADAETEDLIVTVTGKLRGNELTVFKMTYRDGLSVSAIAMQLGVTVQRVYVIHSGIISKISAFLEGKKDAFCPN